MEPHASVSQNIDSCIEWMQTSQQISLKNLDFTFFLTLGGTVLVYFKELEGTGILQLLKAGNLEAHFCVIYAIKSHIRFLFQQGMPACPAVGYRNSCTQGGSGISPNHMQDWGELDGIRRGLKVLDIVIMYQSSPFSRKVNKNKSYEIGFAHSGAR